MPQFHRPDAPRRSQGVWRSTLQCRFCDLDFAVPKQRCMERRQHGQSLCGRLVIETEHKKLSVLVYF